MSVSVGNMVPQSSDELFGVYSVESTLPLFVLSPEPDLSICATDETILRYERSANIPARVPQEVLLGYKVVNIDTPPAFALGR